MDVFITIIVICLCIMIWRFNKYYHEYWKRKGVPYLKPLPFFGNIIDLVLFNKPQALVHHDIYKCRSSYKLAGLYFFYRPILLIRDPELIKLVLTKDFSHFSDRRAFKVNKDEPLTRQLFHLPREEWKILRSKLSPCFTSGRLKLMFYLMNDATEELVKVIGNMMNNENEDIEIRDLMERYATDVITSCGFGEEAKTLENGDSEFRRMGNKVFKPSWRSLIRDRIYMISPRLSNLIAPKVWEPLLTKFFLSVTSQTVEYREKNNIKRNDFMQLLISARDEEMKQKADGLLGSLDHNEMTTEFMAAQCFAFFTAAFESTSSALSFALFEVARNMDIQDTLRKEIDRVLLFHNGEVTYESITEMKYLDKVVSETLRLYPTSPVLHRICTQTYKIPNSQVVIQKGSTVFIAVYGLHYDPLYYPNPMEFNPDNFSDESKASRPHYTYIPFGGGPRICLGARFGLMLVKLGLVRLLKNYMFGIADKTTVPIKLTPNMNLTSCNNVWLKCSKRKD